MIYPSLHCECQLHYWASSRASYHLQGKYRLVTYLPTILTSEYLTILLLKQYKSGKIRGKTQDKQHGDIPFSVVNALPQNMINVKEFIRNAIVECQSQPLFKSPPLFGTYSYERMYFLNQKNRKEKEAQISKYDGFLGLIIWQLH